MTTNFEPHECVIFAQTTKIDTHENKAIHSTYLVCCSFELVGCLWLNVTFSNMSAI